MKLLVLAPSNPFPPSDGVQLRLANLLTRLPAGTEVELLCFHGVPNAQEQPLPAPHRGRLVQVPTPPAPAGWSGSRLAQLLRREPTMIWRFRSDEMMGRVRSASAEADAVLAVGLQMGQYLAVLPSGTPAALDNYNVESRILERLAGTRSGLKRLYWLREAAKMRAVERRTLRLAPTTFAISEVDAAAMREMEPGAQVVTVPMSIEVDTFRNPGEALSAPPRFTFVGAFNWHVNEDAALWLASEVWPLIRRAIPAAELHLVGRAPSVAVAELGRLPGISVSGTVPDVRPYLWRSTALLVPLRYGSGVRTKILEAFAAGRPVVSTPVGCEGLPVRHGEHLLVAGEAAGFAGACIELARRADRAQALVDQALQVVRSQDHAATLAWHRTLAETLGFPRDDTPLRPRPRDLPCESC